MYPAVFVSLESPREDAAKTLVDLGLDLNRVWITDARDWRAVALSARPRLTVVDSISVFDNVIAEMKAAHEWAHAHRVTVAAICHATVDGKAKGGTGPTHWSDAALVVKPRGKGLVSLETPTKNRFGPTGPGRPVGRGTIA